MELVYSTCEFTKSRDGPLFTGGTCHYHKVYYYFRCPRCGGIQECGLRNGRKQTHCRCTPNAVKWRFRKHPLYMIWQLMIRRCYHEKSREYKWYGGRGILVCEEWRTNADAFVSWCLENGWKRGLEIDREDNNDGYSPENCRFVTHAKNSRNRQSTTLTESQVIQIREELKRGKKRKVLAFEYGVHLQVIHHIAQHRTWKGVVKCPILQP